MNKPSLYLKSFSLILSVGLVMSASAMAIASLKPSSLNQVNQKPSETVIAGNKGLRFSRKFRPSLRRTGGFARGTCKVGNQNQEVNATAILPKVAPEDFPEGVPTSSDKPPVPVELTVEENPTFLVHVTETEQKEAIFTLVLPGAQQDQIVYETTVSIEGKSPGIVSITVPEKDPAHPDHPLLEMDKVYEWHFVIPCDQTDWSQNPTAQGAVKRIAKDDSLVQELAQTPELEQPAVFAARGVWTETVSSLAKLRELYPNNPQVQTDWHDLLQSVGLENLIADSRVNN